PGAWCSWARRPVVCWHRGTRSYPMSSGSEKETIDMPQSSLARVRDPLIEHFVLDELPKIAPWVAERIAAEGPARIAAILSEMGEPEAAHSMRSWVTALHRATDDFSEALEA